MAGTQTAHPRWTLRKEERGAPLAPLLSEGNVGNVCPPEVYYEIALSARTRSKLLDQNLEMGIIFVISSQKTTLDEIWEQILFDVLWIRTAFTYDNRIVRSTGNTLMSHRIIQIKFFEKISLILCLKIKSRCAQKDDGELNIMAVDYYWTCATTSCPSLSMWGTWWRRFDAHSRLVDWCLIYWYLGTCHLLIKT